LSEDAWVGDSLKSNIAFRLSSIEGIGEIWLPLRIGSVVYIDGKPSFVDTEKQMDEFRQMFRDSAIKRVPINR
jgi:hypothetical protein